MSIVLVGLNHRTAPVEIREQLAFSRDGVSTALMFFRKQFPGSEAAIISTCNRVEILVAADGDRPCAADIISFLAEARDLPAAQFKQYLYQFSDEQACRHFFRVVSGLDSMVLGECQIVNQIKQAYTLACEQGTTGRVLNRLFHHAFEVGKRARSGNGHRRRKTFRPLGRRRRRHQHLFRFHRQANARGRRRRSGEAGLRASGQQRSNSPIRGHVSNAEQLAALAEACQAVAAPFEQLETQLVDADIVLMAMGCAQPVLTAAANARDTEAAAKQADLHRRPGRALATSIRRLRRLEGVYLYDIDDLGRIVTENQKHRATALEQCERILDEEVTAFIQWLNEVRLNPIIAQMYRDAKSVRDVELDRLLRKCPDLTESQKQAIAQGIDRLVGKFMHPCVFSLRQSPNPAMLALADALHAASPQARRAGIIGEQQLCPLISQPWTPPPPQFRSIHPAIGQACGNSLREVDRQILAAVQEQVPFSPRPYAAIAGRLDLPESLVLERLRNAAGRPQGRHPPDRRDFR